LASETVSNEGIFFPLKMGALAIAIVIQTLAEIARPINQMRLFYQKQAALSV
jgi:hypothetical protein